MDCTTDFIEAVCMPFVGFDLNVWSHIGKLVIGPTPTGWLIERRPNASESACLGSTTETVSLQRFTHPDVLRQLRESKESTTTTVQAGRLALALMTHEQALLQLVQVQGQLFPAQAVRNLLRGLVAFGLLHDDFVNFTVAPYAHEVNGELWTANVLKARWEGEISFLGYALSTIGDREARIVEL